MNNQDISGMPLSGLIPLAAKLASAYVAHNAVQSADLPKVIETIYLSLKSICVPKAAPEPPRREPPISIRRSVTPDAIISMEDGKPYKLMKRHLRSRGMTPQEYREKWGLPHDYPMVASSFTAKRSELAKSLGLGRKKKAVSESAPIRKKALDKTSRIKPE